MAIIKQSSLQFKPDWSMRTCDKPGWNKHFIVWICRWNKYMKPNAPPQCLQSPGWTCNWLTAALQLTKDENSRLLCSWQGLESDGPWHAECFPQGTSTGPPVNKESREVKSHRSTRGSEQIGLTKFEPNKEQTETCSQIIEIRVRSP